MRNLFTMMIIQLTIMLKKITSLTGGEDGKVSTHTLSINIKIINMMNFILMIFSMVKIIHLIIMLKKIMVEKMAEMSTHTLRICVSVTISPQRFIEGRLFLRNHNKTLFTGKNAPEDFPNE